MQISTSLGDCGQYFHVVARVSGRVFCLDDEAKGVFVDLMRKVEGFSGVVVITWTLMDNHFHLVLHVPEKVEDLPEEEFWERLSALYSKEKLSEIRATIESFHRMNPGRTAVDQEQAYRQKFLKRMHDLSEFMKTLLQRFSTWFNKRHDRCGRLWESRFKSLLIEGGWDYLMNVAAYVDLNAVRAGIVTDPKDYHWCGYAEAVAGKAPARKGLAHLMWQEATARGEAVPDWQLVGREYRKNLFGVGEEIPASEGFEGRRGIPAEAVAQVQAEGGRLSMPQLLRCRIRYFTDGVVIGTKAFVDAFFEEKREYFGPRRKSGARKMRGGDWGELRTLRDLRKHVPGAGAN